MRSAVGIIAVHGGEDVNAVTRKQASPFLAAGPNRRAGTPWQAFDAAVQQLKALQAVRMDGDVTRQEAQELIEHRIISCKRLLINIKCS